MSDFSIDGIALGDEAPCYVIAEVGHNHQGSLEQAKELFRAAKECGASAVKLQKRENPTLYTRTYFERPYDNENSFGRTYGEHREALEFGRAEYAELRDYAAELGITFFATAFDFASADFLAGLDMPAYKIASGDLRNTPLLRYVAEIGRPVILSTGGALLSDARRAYETVAEVNGQVGILQCTAGYPVAWEELDLRVIETYRQEFPGAVIGLSAHDNGIAMAVAAYVLGARIVEKHFTLNRAARGTDHSFSLEPVGLRKLVRDLERVRVALGDGSKRIHESELAPIEKMSKKIVARFDLAEGHRIRLEDLALKSPGDGLPPYEAENLIGRVLSRALAEDETITFEMLAPLELDAARAPVPTFGYGA
ncbi:MAG TPA: N-acetylneuraminate synthase family protein [Gaiellaceae bacterium]|nr:N-acetylneuraminate synthase family protein [Gaiellaceae bacterium]